uniref:hypothetical protein n=1 Tax=Klebsiella pneumoniae TaxID=573 RepID=UPI001E330C08|nr:hypothetical protein [Klebsiella pneumoniae]
MQADGRKQTFISTRRTASRGLHAAEIEQRTPEMLRYSAGENLYYTHYRTRSITSSSTT